MDVKCKRKAEDEPKTAAALCVADIILKGVVTLQSIESARSTEGMSEGSL